MEAIKGHKRKQTKSRANTVERQLPIKRYWTETQRFPYLTAVQGLHQRQQQQKQKNNNNSEVAAAGDMACSRQHNVSPVSDRIFRSRCDPVGHKCRVIPLRSDNASTKSVSSIVHNCLLQTAIANICQFPFLGIVFGNVSIWRARVRYQYTLTTI